MESIIHSNETGNPAQIEGMAGLLLALPQNGKPFSVRLSDVYHKYMSQLSDETACVVGDHIGTLAESRFGLSNIQFGPCWPQIDAEFLKGRKLPKKGRHELIFLLGMMLHMGRDALEYESFRAKFNELAKGVLYI